MKEKTHVTRIPTDQSPLWKKKGPLLERLDLELTERCNNRCSHCYINRPATDRVAKAKELATEALKGIIEQAAALGCLTIRFTGGEPLLREDFSDLYLWARRLGLKVSLFTNATLITPELADLLARIPPLEKIEISLYGMSEQSYEAVSRIPGSFRATWQGIGLLLEKNVPFTAKFVMLPSNRDDREDFEQWATLVPGMEKPPAYVWLLDGPARPDRARQKAIDALRFSPQEGFKILTRRKDEYVQGMRNFCARFTRPLGEKLFSCGAGLGHGSVDAYGVFQPCLLLRHPDTVYPLKDGSLKEALTGFFPGVRELKAQNPDFRAHCARCFLRGLCEQCPAKSWMEHGTLDTPVKYLCDITHAQAGFLGLLEGDEKAWEVKDWNARIRRLSGETGAGY